MISAALLAAALTCAAPGAADAKGLWGRSTTYARGFVRPADQEVAQYLPFYELLELSTRDLGVEGLSVDASLWGMVDALDIQDTSRATGDINALYITYRAPEEGLLSVLHGLTLTAGRQFVSLGPTVLEQVDGGKAHYLHSSGLEVGVFGGAPTGMRILYNPWPVEGDLYSRGNNWVVGGRLGWLGLGYTSGGVSYVHRRYVGQVADHDIGADLTVAPLRWLDVSGAATLSLEAMRLKEARGTIAVRPLRALAVNAAYRFSSPDLWIPRTSIFAVFSQESFHEASLEARYRIRRTISLEGAYGRRFYMPHGHDDDGHGDHDDELTGANRASLRATWRFVPGGRGVLAFERVEMSDNAANRARVAAALPLHLLGRRFHLVADVDMMVLDETIRGARFSLVAGGYLRAPILDSLTLLAGGSGGFSPLFSRVGTFTVRLTWEFDAFTGGGVSVKRGRMM